MNNIVMVMIVCLNGACERHVLLRDMTLAGCTTASQIAAAQWIAQHPEWTVKAIRCELGEEA